MLAALLLMVAAPVRAQDAPETPKAAPRGLRDAVAIAWADSSKKDPADHLSRAEEARKRGQWLDAARLAMHVPNGRADLLKRRDRVLREAGPHLTAAAIACLQAWFGPNPELEVAYARSMMSKGQYVEAKAQAVQTIAVPRSASARKESQKIVEDIAKLGDGPPKLELGAPGATQSVFQVALLAPFSGDYEPYGKSLRAGLELAIIEYNAKARLPVRLMAYDTEAEAYRAVAAGRRALDAGAGVLVGDVTSVPTFVLSGIARERGVTLLSPSASDPMVGTTGAFQTGASASDQARALARYIVREQHRTVVAVPTNTDTEFVAAFETEMTKLGARTVRLRAAAGLRDFKAVADEIRKSGPHAILLPSQPEQAELWVTALAREKLLLPLLATEAVDPQSFRPDTRKNLENMTVVGLDYALPPATFARVDSLAQAGYGLAADRYVRRGYLTGRMIGAALAVADSPTLFSAVLARRSGPLGFVQYEESEATLPILSVRRGQLVRVK